MIKQNKRSNSYKISPDRNKEYTKPLKTNAQKTIGKIYFEMLSCAIALAPLDGLQIELAGKNYKKEKLRAILPDLFLNNELPDDIRRNLVNNWGLPKSADILEEGGFGRFEPESLLRTINHIEALWLIQKFMEMKYRDCAEFYASKEDEKHEKPEKPKKIKGKIFKLFKRN